MTMLLRFTGLLLIVFLVSNCKNNTPEQNEATQFPDYPWKLVCLGDDWTIGTGLTPNEAYPALLAKKMEEEQRIVKIVNAGIKGESVQGAAARVDWILQQRLDVILLAYGLADAKKEVPLTDQIEAWSQLLGKIRQAAPDLPIIVLDTGVVYRKRNIPKELLEAIEKNNARIVGLELPNPQKAPELWQSDKTLLSAKGQRVLAEKLLQQIAFLRLND